MKSCIVGGSGFIGNFLVNQLVASGKQVLVLGRRPEPSIPLPAGVEYVSGSYGDRQLLRHLFQEVNEVYDLAYATVPKSSFEDPVFDIVDNLPSSVTLLQEARLANLKRLLIVSSGGVVYGPSKILPITEDSPTNPISPYGITKLTIEKYALMFYHLHGLPVTIVRPSNAYGVGQKPFIGQGFIATAMGLILQNKPVTIFGENGTIRDYIHVEDVASGITAAATKGHIGQIYNISSGVGLNNIDVLKFIEKIASQHGAMVKVEIKPDRGFDVPVNILSHNKLTQHTGWSPKVSFEDGVNAMWRSIAFNANLK